MYATEVEEVVKWFAKAVSPQAGYEDCLSLFCKVFCFVMHLLNRVGSLCTFFLIRFQFDVRITGSISLTQVKSIEYIVLFGINNYKKPKEEAVMPATHYNRRMSPVPPCI